MSVDTADIAIRDHDKNLTARVEIKNIPNLSSERAEALRQAMRLDEARTPYLLLLSQDKGYVWKLSAEDAAPARVEIDMKRALRRHWGSIPKSVRLRHNELQLIVRQWLWNLVTATDASELDNGIGAKLRQIGLLDAIRNGYVEVDYSA